MKGGPLILLLAAGQLAAQDLTWMNGQSRQRAFPLAGLHRSVTFSVYLDSYFAYSMHRPSDHTLTSSATVGRHGEFQLNLAGVGVEWNYRNVIGRLSLQTGGMLNLVQDADASVTRGRNLTTDNLRNIREATVGYHWDVAEGLNVEAGIFMSYIGLESYLLAENWSYNRSFVSEFTPFYFQGVRAQYFPSAKWKVEPWVMNGWQTYGMWNDVPSVGLSSFYRPRESLGFVANVYYGADTRDDPGRKRLHSDHSILARYFNAPQASGVSKAAFSINNHVGLERWGLSSVNGSFVGTAVAHRVWMARDQLAFTVRGELVSNPGRYLAIPPTPAGFVDGGTDLRLRGLAVTFDIMPTDFFAWRVEYLGRVSNVPYYSARVGLAKNQHLLIAGLNFRL